MSDDIKLIRNNDKREWTDLEWVEEFFRFLTGDVPAKISFKRGHQPKMSENKAFSIIWYLQEHFSLIPDKIERCDVCGGLYDTYRSGHYCEARRKHYCSHNCERVFAGDHGECKKKGCCNEE